MIIVRLICRRMKRDSANNERKIEDMVEVPYLDDLDRTSCIMCKTRRFKRA